MSNERKRSGGEAGISLVDLMIGAIVSIVLIGAVLSMVVHQGHLRQSNSETGLALNAILNNLERLRTVSQITLPTLNGTGFDVPGSNGQPGGLSPVPGDLDDLPGELQVIVDQVSGGTILYRVVASVTWTGVTGRRRYTLQTLMGERK